MIRMRAATGAAIQFSEYTGCTRAGSRAAEPSAPGACPRSLQPASPTRIRKLMIRLRPRTLRLAAAGLLMTSAIAFADDFTDVDRLFGAGQLAEALQRADQSLATRPQEP